MRGQRRVSQAGLLLACALLGVVVPENAEALGTPPTYAYVGHEALGPGVDHYLLRQGDPIEEVHIAQIDRSQLGRLRVVTAFDHVGGVPTERTSSMCERVRCVLAVNGDYTDLAYGGPIGSTVADGELLRTPRQRHGNFSIRADGRVRIDHDLIWHGVVEAGSASLALWGVNVVRPSEGPVLYTTRWGSSTRTRGGGLEIVARLADHHPTAAGTSITLGGLYRKGNAPIEPGTVVISGESAGGAALHRWWDRVGGAGSKALLKIDTGATTEAVGGSPVIVENRNWAFPNNRDDFTQSRHPRTAVGWTAAGDILLVTVDGRQPGYSLGMNLAELSNLMIQLGAVESLNLDGGGSTTFVTYNRVRNRPSDGAERPVSSALVLLPPVGTVGTAIARNIGSACQPFETSEYRFADVSGRDPHAPAVACAAWWKVAGGTGPGRYDPTGMVSRGQLASFLARLVNRSGGRLPANPRDRFPDDSHSPHRRAIDKVVAVGIMAGAADGRFRPDAPVTREQLATALAQALEYRIAGKLPATPDYFTDDDGIHQAAINKLARAALVTGVEHNHYVPKAVLRRDEMATLLARSLDLLVEEDDAPMPSHHVYVANAATGLVVDTP